MKKNSIKKNMIMNVILTLSNILFPLITFSYVSKVLTPVGTGKVAFASSIISYFSYIAILGIPGYGIREAAKIKDDKNKLSTLVSELFTLNIISTLVSYLILLIVLIFFNKLAEYRLLIIIMSSSIFLNTIGCEWLYNAMEDYSYITKRSLIFKIIYIPLVFLLIKSPDDYLYYGILSIFVSSANYICNFINLRKIVKIQRVKIASLKKHMKPVIILFSTSLIISVYANFDTFMLGIMKNDWSVGIYNTAYKLKNLVLSLSTAITAVLIPRISYVYNKKNMQELNRLIMLSFKITLLVTIPLAIYIILNAKSIIIFLFGNEYLPAVNTLKVLMFCIIPLALTNLFGNQLLIPMGKEKIFTQSVFGGMIINLVLNYLLIPKFGPLGAAIGTLLTEIWNLFYMGFHLMDKAFYLLHNSKLYKFIISLVIALLINIFIIVTYESSNVLILLLITGIEFFGLYYLFLVLQKEEFLLKNLKLILRKISGNK